MALVLDRHKFSSFDGVGHYGADSVPKDVPLPTVFESYISGSGKKPASAILWNWTGNTDSPAASGAFSTGAERNEKAIGGSYKEGDVIVLTFSILFDPTTTNPNVVDWNYIMQHRSNGSTPSPAPCIGILGDKLILRRNISGFGSTYDVIGDLDEGKRHDYKVGYCWSTSASKGWVEVWRDGVNVLPRKNVRTAYDTSNGATLRFGAGYRNPAINGPVKYWLVGLELHNSFPTGGTTPPVDPPPPPPVDTTPPTIHVTQPAPLSVVKGKLAYRVEFTDTSGVAEVTYALKNEAGAEVWSIKEVSPPLDDSDDFNPFDTTTVADGTYKFSVTAKDGAGNSGSSEVTILVDNVIDPAPPPSGPDLPGIKSDFEAIKASAKSRKEYFAGRVANEEGLFINDKATVVGYFEAIEGRAQKGLDKLV